MKKFSWLLCVSTVFFVSTVVSNANLIGYWQLNDASGSLVVKDYSALSHDGNNVGGNVGFNNNYGAFAGESARIELAGDPNYTTKSSFSWAASIKQAVGTTGAHIILGRGPAWVDGARMLRIQDGVVDFQAWGATGAVVGKTLVNDGNWHHVVVTYDGTTNLLRLFIDGVQDAATVTDLKILNENLDTALNIGFGNGLGWYTGDIKEVRIYNEAISPATVAVLVSSAYKPQLVGYWKLNDAAGTVSPVVDSSRFNNNGTNVGGAVVFNSDYGDFSASALDYVQLPVDGIYNTKASFSWSARVKQPAGTTGAHIILGRGPAWVDGARMLRITDGVVDFQAYGATGVAGTTLVNDGNWHNVTVTYDDTKNFLCLYIDGVEEAATVSNWKILNENIGTALTIGFANGIAWYSGYIEEVRIYDGAFSPMGVAELAGVAYKPRLSGYWKMNDLATSTVAADSSGMGNDAAADSGSTTFNGSYGQFHGAPNVVRLPGAGGYDTVTSFSWAASIRTASQNYWNSVISLGTGWAPGSTVLRINGGDGGGVADFQKAGAGGVRGTTVVNDGVWHHIAVTWDQDTQVLNFYTDGKLEGSVTSNLAAVADAGTPLIGLFNGVAWSDLDIQNVRIYDGALTSSQAAELAGIFKGDYNGDHSVNFKDLRTLTLDWLKDSTLVAGVNLNIENGTFEGYASTAALQGDWAERNNGLATSSTVSLLTSGAYQGSKAMRWVYNANDTSGILPVTEIFYAFDTPIDLSSYDSISLRINRHAGNSHAYLLYVKILDWYVDQDGLAADSYLYDTEGSTYANPDQWFLWNIDLHNMDLWHNENGYYSVADLMTVKGIVLGVYDPYNRGSGTIDVDDIRIITKPQCSSTSNDLTGDCFVNFADFAVFAENWLRSADNVF